ncbi:hypothetical protein GDO78_011659 [Eleutherodactylus coqui]|uniref:Uncharacterized protein n=1 Tax=Eleutherodactylus coqui TaxID=57060 RepID=A0A8J6F2T6_ELECQ|nr:hypothetical protein GDO78_011659 [Eleutherodactylus coqui]
MSETTALQEEIRLRKYRHVNTPLCPMKAAISWTLNETLLILYLLQMSQFSWVSIRHPRNIRGYLEAAECHKMAAFTIIL